MSSQQPLVGIALSSLFFMVACKSEAPPAPVGTLPSGYPQAGQPMGQPAQPGQMPAAPGQPVAQPGVAPPAQPGQPVPAAQPVTAPAGQPAQNPMAGLMGALGAMQGQQQAGQPAQAIPWQSLVQALPVNAPGWALDGEPEGESAAFGGFTSSTAKCRLKQGTMTASVEIVDTSVNPMIAMPFNMARSMRIDSSDERMGPIDFGTYPGTQKLSKKSNRAEVMVMVANRVLVTVKVTGATAEAPAVGVMQYVNFAHLSQLAGG